LQLQEFTRQRPFGFATVVKVIAPPDEIEVCRHISDAPPGAGSGVVGYWAALMQTDGAEANEYAQAPAAHA